MAARTYAESLGSAAQAGSQAGDQLVGRLLVGDGVHGHRATGRGQHDRGAGLVLPGLHVELRIEVEPGDEGRPVALVRPPSGGGR